MAVYIEGHAESLVAAADESVAAEERLRRETEKLSATQTSGGKTFASYSSTTRSSRKSTEEHEKATKKLGSGLKTAATSAGAFIGAYAGYEALKSAAEYTEELVHQTQILTNVSGLDTKQASQWIEMAKQRGIDTTKLGMAFTTLSKQIRGAETGSKTAEKNFHALGIPLEELRHLSTEEVLERIADKFSETSDGAKKAALNQAFFGKSARDLLPVLDQGSEGLKKQLGLFSGLSEAQQKKGEEALAVQRKIGVEMDKIRLKVTFGMLGVAKAISNPHLTLDQKIDYVMKKADGLLEKGVAFMAENAAKHGPEVAEAFAKGFLDAPVLDQAIFGSMLFAKLGGLGMLGGLFTEEGKLSATSFTGGLKAALPATLAAVGLDNILTSALQGDTKGALYKSGAAAAGALVGGIVGGLPGALAGAGIGSLVGGELGNLLGGEAVKKSVPAYRKARSALDGYRRSAEDLTRAKGKEKEASEESRSAEERLQRIRSAHGPNSKAAIRAELDYRGALNKTDEAIKRTRNLERAHGSERHALMMLLRIDVRQQAKEAEKANTLRKIEAEGLKHTPRLIREGFASYAELRQRLKSYREAAAEASKKNAHLRETIAGAAKEIGGPYAASLERIADRSRKAFDETDNLAQAVKSADHKRATEAKRARDEEASAEEDAASRSTKSIRKIQEKTEGYGSTTKATAHRAETALGDLKAIYRALDTVGVAALGELGTKTNAFLQALGQKTVPFSLGKAEGGPVTVPGTGLQDTVPLFVNGGLSAVVAPGEKLFAANRHQQPLLDEAVSSAFGVDGLDGFFASFDQPHYLARGGLAEPVLHGGLPTLRSGGQRDIHRAFLGAKAYIAAHDGIARVIANGNRMDALRQPYLWGGGHGATASRNGPWDCSGGISELADGADLSGPDFNFAPMVSGGFETWGLPGKGDFTVLANAEHVYGVLKTPHGWRAIGTSGENPGGGFGWIDGYTFRPGFAVRHADFGATGGRRVGKGGKGQAQKKGFQRGGNVNGNSSYAKYFPHARRTALRAWRALGRSGAPDPTILFNPIKTPYTDVGTSRVHIPSEYAGDIFTGSGSAQDYIRRALVHEFAHTMQKRVVLDSVPEREGGATWFANIEAPGVWKKLGLSYAKPADYGAYATYLNKVQHEHSRRWALKGQFRKFAKGGLVVSGKVSYEGGTGHMTADGKHTDEDPGFAIRDDSTLGDWFWAEVGGAKGMLQHTDWGPAEWTGRSIDFTAAGLKKIGSPLSITDTTGRVTWLGHSVPAAAKQARALGFLPGGGAGKTGTSGKPHYKMGISPHNTAVAMPPLKAGPISPLAAALPPSIRAMLKTPGLTYAQKLSIGELASSLAGETEGTADDVAAAKFQASLVGGDKKRVERRLAEISARLKKPGLSAKQRKKLLAQQAELITRLGTDTTTLSGLEATINGGGEGPGEGEDQTLQEINQNLEAMLQLQKEESERVKAAFNVSQTQYGALAKAITDVVSGQIGGQVGLGFQTPSVAGSTASY